jgi:maltose alpha-D-glucosyltransferase/alpha-amylase
VHLALADSEDVALRPEPFTPMHQQSMFQSARAMAMRTIDRLAVLIPTLPSDAVVAVATLRARQDSLERRLRAVQARPLTAVRLRAHGDLHLGHLLHAGGELVVVDLAGEPARPLSARRYKRSPLRDVATLLRSLGEVASAAGATGRVRPLDQAAVAPWSAAAAAWMQAALLGAYAARASSLVPARPADRRTLLDFYALELALAELWTASIRDPARVPAALTALLALLE